MKTTATIEADQEKKTLCLTIAEQAGEITTRNSQTAKITPESRLHARQWIAAQYEILMQLLDEA